MMLVLCGVAWAWTPPERESLRYVAEWMGIEAGVAEAETVGGAAAWTTVVTTRSADWLAGLYPIDDRVESTWALDGSRRYVTHFREGHFQQDQDMRFGSEGIEVARRQRFAEGWRDWADRYDPAAGVLDPLAALMALRHEGGGRELQVFSGKAVKTVFVADGGTETVPEGVAQRFELRMRKEGVLEDKITAWISTDAARVPLRAVVRTRAGPVTVRRVVVP